MDKKSRYHLIILGSGAAGLTAAIYAARANLNPLVIEGSQPGGQLTITTDVENYPGFANGIMGPDLMNELKKQAVRFGTETLFGEVTSVNLKERPFQIVAGKETYSCDAVIVATGATAKLLGLESEMKLMGHGVSACATCDGFFFKDKDLVVVGGGDTAMEEATFLSKFANKVTVVHRRDKLRASKIMQERAEKNPKIFFVWDTIVDEVYGDPKAGGVTGVRFKSVKTGMTEHFRSDGLFIAIGHEPNSKLFVGQLDMDANGYIITRDGTKTNIPGVFACGDVQDHVYRQAVTAAGTGCMAAIDAERYLESQKA
ncbi:MAG: thioredoxin-disulfide reductase [Candidatus Binatia bacterium]